MPEQHRQDMPSGTQSLTRSITLLRVMVTRGEIGWRLSDLAAVCGLDKGTAHRILAGLVKERLVQQRPSDRRYLAGPLLYELSLSLPGHHEFQRLAEAQLGTLARRLHGTALLLLRSGHEYVCSVCIGPARLPGLMVEQGTRRPLFTSVGGVAILQTLDADEAQEVMQHNIAHETSKRGEARMPALQKMRERSARYGFGVNLNDVVAGIHAFGVPLRAPNGKAFAALCLMGTAERFGEARIDEIRGELDRQAIVLEADAARTLYRSHWGDL
jgi:DNA-binding IclR family transcriptional regulator